MPRTFVCSVGTSAAKGFGPPAKLAEWVRAQPDEATAGQLLFEKVKDFKPEGDNLHKELSAEVHSLTRMEVSGQDRVILLCSETPDGGACGHAVSVYLEQYHPGIACDVRKVEGLQVRDADQFRTKGVVNFVRECLKAVNDYGSQNVILNPTGGFKALVPYAVLVGMLKRVTCRYIFEQSTSVLTLPPLPVAIDRGPFERYRSLLGDIERDTSISLARWQSEVHHDDQPLLEPLVEVIGTDVTISGVGELFLDELRTPTALVPFLSRQAWADCHGNLSQLAQCDPYRFLARIAADANAFKLAEHIATPAGLRWMKPGRTTDRYLVSVEGWKLLVWRAIREDEVGGNYAQKVTADPDADRSRYGPFTRMEFAHADGIR